MITLRIHDSFNTYPHTDSGCDTEPRQTRKLDESQIRLRRTVK